MKNLFIAEKPSVANEFALALGGGAKRNGYIEADSFVVTWCVGHLVTMSYPESYDEKYKRWSLDTLPFIPETFKYEVIGQVKKQFDIVKELLTREDISCIYICTDSGREGEYIYRLVDMLVKPKNKLRKRVWIDSQTKEEILRGIKDAKDWSEYDNLAQSAFLRAKEDYLMGINFSRLMTLKYGNSIAALLKLDKAVLSVGRVMTCVLGMVVRREKEIRDFVKTPFFRVIGKFEKNSTQFEAEWKVTKSGRYFNSSKLYKENGFKSEEDAKRLIACIKEDIKNLNPLENAIVEKLEKKKEVKNPPLLFNLAELQGECAKRFKISPDETLKHVQELYEKKLVTYPRTDARVLSTAVAKEIKKNLSGLLKVDAVSKYANNILNLEVYKKIIKSRYINDSQITDHYAIIPTGQGTMSLKGLAQITYKIYELIVRRFLSIFYNPAVYEKYMADIVVPSNYKLDENVLDNKVEKFAEHFFANLRVLKEKGYLEVYDQNDKEKIDDESKNSDIIKELKKGIKLTFVDAYIKEGETSPPKRYSSGTMILAMENAGQLIEDEDLRSQIKGSGIGTSATRAEILKKLFNIKYLNLNKKTQIITPSIFGEMVYEAVNASIKQLLNPELTASWEKGLTYVSEGSITSDEYMVKLDNFIRSRIGAVLNLNNQYVLKQAFDNIHNLYKK
jgi:DNA topoisomerase